LIRTITWWQPGFLGSPDIVSGAKFKLEQIPSPEKAMDHVLILTLIPKYYKNFRHVTSRIQNMLK
jgi:hypothetical protein